MPTIHLVTRIDAPVERCFDLARSLDVHLDSAAQTRERAVSGVTTGLLGHGDIVTWEAIHFGVRLHLTVRITEFDRSHRFVDELVHGPFHDLRHVHAFYNVPNGTLMVDTFTFHSPLGILGRIVDALVLARYMRAFLRKRNLHLKRAAESPYV